MGSRDVAAPERTAVQSGGVPSSRVIVACLLGWVLPGAGHWYLGRRARAVVFFCLITVSFVLGALLHGRFSVVDRRQPLLSVLQVVACLGSGPMEIIGRTAVYGAPVYKMPQEDDVGLGEQRRPRTPVGMMLRTRNEAFDSVYGTAYLWTAGLMNLLLLLDVFDIGIGRKS